MSIRRHWEENELEIIPIIAFTGYSPTQEFTDKCSNVGIGMIGNVLYYIIIY